eukprot:6177517-Pleurochrysis_carterae.AAC.1
MKARTLRCTRATRPANSIERREAAGDSRPCQWLDSDARPASPIGHLDIACKEQAAGSGSADH